MFMAAQGRHISREKQVHVYIIYLPKNRDVASLSKFVTVFVDLLQHVSITVAKTFRNNAIAHVFRTLEIQM